jgi:hypothetical protein
MQLDMTTWPIGRRYIDAVEWVLWGTLPDGTRFERRFTTANDAREYAAACGWKIERIESRGV